MQCDNEIASSENGYDDNSTEYEMELDDDAPLSDVCTMSIDELKSFVRSQLCEQRRTFNCDMQAKLDALTREY